MIGFQIPNGFIDIANPVFYCPHCGKVYIDGEDKYWKRCYKNKYGNARIKCSCGQAFHMTYSYMGNAVSFDKTNQL